MDAAVLKTTAAAAAAATTRRRWTCALMTPPETAWCSHAHPNGYGLTERRPQPAPAVGRGRAERGNQANRYDAPILHTVRAGFPVNRRFATDIHPQEGRYRGKATVGDGGARRTYTARLRTNRSATLTTATFASNDEPSQSSPFTMTGP